MFIGVLSVKKGNVSLKDFIEEVKSELKSAVGEETLFFLMEEVELEVSFTLDAKAEGSAKLVVLDVGGNVQASQVSSSKIEINSDSRTVETQAFSKGGFPKPPCG
ncbi:hypothetical protein CGK42_22325 [Vibrio parahaemolyticus]|uniref:trypco2 family protein n=1 Tax=Vibrio parahaemolyticus TaxID=670 RepID=UPI0011225910|nr:trypco2 family protein [Vibrio parahaemolyticus]TNZ67194.1 hypothetical protein CGK42_22325 [Vibrio parahaemolyticus]